MMRSFADNSWGGSGSSSVTNPPSRFAGHMATLWATTWDTPVASAAASR
jgi:hypothetical protein